MKIYLMRHAEALNPEVDVKRSLSQTGIQNTTEIARFLQFIPVNVTTIFHSGVLRATQTAKIITSIIGTEAHLQILSDLNSPDAAAALADEINLWVQDAILVGHIPLLPRLLGKLVVQNENLWSVYFKFPATIVCLEKIGKQNWDIGWMVYPGILTR